MKSFWASRLYDAGFNFAKLLKNGQLVGKKTKEGATHKLEDTKISVIANPLRKWPKRKGRTYYSPQYKNHIQENIMDKKEIPVGSTHCMYISPGRRTSIIADIKFHHDFDSMRGELIYGRYHLRSDRFESLMPNAGTPSDPLIANEQPSRCPISEHRSMKHIIREISDLVDERDKQAKGKKPASPAKATAKSTPLPPKSKPAQPVATKPAQTKSTKTPKGESVCGFIDGLIMEGGRTKEEICQLVLAKFPGRDPKSTMSTIAVRPTHIRKAGKNPPPFKK